MKKSAVRYLGLVLVAAVATGCAEARSHVKHTGDPIVDAKAECAQGLPKDKVLWEYRGAAAAMRLGDYDDAKMFLDDALARINGLMGKDESAKKARSNFAAESKKTFVGEPYERVMANLYRGILYWMNGEVDNAHAAFLNAQFMDSDAEKKEFQADYVLLEILSAMTAERMHVDATESWKRANDLAKGRVQMPDPKANVILFTEFGNGPVKYSTGEPGARGATSARVTVDSATASLPVYDDLYYQATTRGGRVMDFVLKNKAVFKDNSNKAGDVLMATGAAVAQAASSMNSSAGGIAGLALFFSGLIAKGIAAAANPAADVRMWDNLPQYLSFAALSLPPGPHSATVEFLDDAGTALASKTVAINVADGKDTVVFVSEKAN